MGDDEQLQSTELSLTASPGFSRWLWERRASLTFATPPSKVFFVGVRSDGQLGVFERTFDKAMGVAVQGEGDHVWLGTRTHLWRMDSVPVPAAERDEGFDRCYAPLRAHTTGYLNTHDVTVDDDGGVVFVATRFGCLARPSGRASFEPVWQPPWLERFEQGDRCHLNGFTRDASGRAYVTSVSATGGMESWRDHRNGGGVVADVPSGEIVATGFSMPHSPRLRDGELWCTNSGSGNLCRVDLERGTFEDVAFAPGFLRGLCFLDGYAVVGSSRPREGDLYSGLPLDDALLSKGLKPRLGLFVIELATGNVVEWLFVEGPMRELFDVAALPGVRRPMALGLVAGDIRRNAFYDSSSLARDDHGRWAPVGVGS